jgi:hypothetical protein
MIESFVGITEPVGLLAEEQKALFRGYMYSVPCYHIAPTAFAECKRIRDDTKQAWHDAFLRANVAPITIDDATLTEARTIEYNGCHTGSNNIADCRIVAEAEVNMGGMDYLLSYDADLLRDLRDRTHSITLLTPSDYWASLKIPRGAAPRRVPDSSNPLASQTWWRW